MVKTTGIVKIATIEPMISNKAAFRAALDQIQVLHKGTLREHGTHQSLLAQRGIYFKLFELQYAQ